jgi:hypothetical protein
MKNLVKMKKFNFLLLLLPFLLGCQAKANKVKELCDSYNNQVPLVIDESITLTRVICDDTFFTFNYELKGSEFTKEQLLVLEVLFEKSITSTINELAEFGPLKISGHSIGYIYSNSLGTALISIFFTLNDEGKYVHNEEVSKKVLQGLSNGSSNIPSKLPDANNWKNDEHGISINLPQGFKEEEITENRGLLNAVSEDRKMQIQIIYNDDWSFKTFTNSEYSKAVSKDQIISALGIAYEDIEINIWSPEFLTKSGSVFHSVYTGKLIETGERQTSIIAQFIKNGKLYTIKGISYPEDFKELYSIILNVYDTISFEK